MKPIYFLAGLAPVAAFVSCASPKAVAVNEQTLEPILAAKIVYAPRVPSGPIVQPGGASPSALARKTDAAPSLGAILGKKPGQPAPAGPITPVTPPAEPAPAPAPRKWLGKAAQPPAQAPVPVVAAAPVPPTPPTAAAKKPETAAAAKPKPQKPKVVARNEEPLPTFEEPAVAPKTGANDGLRMPNMLDLPKDDELRAKNPKSKAAPEGGAVISRPPANADKKPKSE